jgi:hypothetical protein
MSIQEIKSKLINLFINVKIRKEDEVKIIFIKKYLFNSLII